MEAPSTAFAYSVVIPTKDRQEIVLRAARRILEQDVLPERVVIVDAGDPGLVLPPELEEAYDAAHVEISVLQSAPSTSGQRNRGLERVETPLVMFLDDDVALPPDYASALLGRWRDRGFDRLGAIAGVSRALPRPSSRLKRAFGAWYRRAFMLHDARSDAHGLSFRKSQKMRWYLSTKPGDVYVPAIPSQAALYRTDLARKHRFDEKFSGYVLGEDLDLGYRVSRETPILLATEAEFIHERQPGERGSRDRWYYHGRSEAYFRLRRLEPTSLARAAFGLSVVGELGAAAADSLRERDLHHVSAYTRGLLESMRDIRAEHRRGHPVPPTPPG
jgi:glycosyltransferase involved in cell wall biosynthesis